MKDKTKVVTEVVEMAGGIIEHRIVGTNLKHNTRGPAVVWPGIGVGYFKTGKPHRVGGPAFEFTNGQQAWYVDGVCLMVKTPNNAITVLDRNDKMHSVGGMTIRL